MTNYEVRVVRSMETTVEVEAESPEDAAKQVDRSDFALPPAEEWDTLKDSYEYTVLDAEGEVLFGTED